MKYLGSFFLLVIAFVGAGLPLAAHHAFGSEFDSTRPVLLKGKVTKVEWVNPHSWIHVEVTKPDGSKEEWMVEGGSPNSLLRRGITRDSLPVGTDVVVDGYQSRDRSLRSYARNVTFPDGRQIFVGSTGAGAPDADQTKPEGK